MAHGHHSFFRLLVADDEHIRHFLKLRFPDLLAELFAADVRFGTQSRRRKLFCDALCRVRGAVGERKHSHLLRREPHGECSVVLLDEHGERALVAAYRTAVDDERTRLFAVLVDVHHVESLREREVQLHGEERVLLAVHVGALHVEFRPVERRFAPRLGVLYAEVVEDGLHRAFAALPVRRVADVFVRIGRIPPRETVGHVAFEVECPEHELDEVHRSRELVLQLVGRAHDVSVRERELAYARKPVHFAARLFAELYGGLRVPYGQVAVGFQPVFVYRELEGTRHRAQAQDLVVHVLLADVEHLVLVVIPVSRGDEQIVLGHDGRLGEQVSAPLFLVLDETLHDLYDARALGHDERKPLSDVLVRHEDAQLSAQLVVVALLRLFELRKVLVKVGFLVERRPVDAREHLVLFVAAPVSACQRRQLETLHLAGGREMGPCAQVREIALRVEADLLSLGNVGKQFHFVTLLGLLDELLRVLAAHGAAHDGHVRLDDALHLGFDLVEVRLRDRRLELEVVVKTVLHRGPYGELYGGINVPHRLRQDVRTGVTVGEPPLFVLERENLEGAVAVDDFVHGHELSVRLRHERGARQPFADVLCNFEGGHTAFELHFAAVFECDDHKNSFAIGPTNGRAFFDSKNNYKSKQNIVNRNAMKKADKSH